MLQLITQIARWRPLVEALGEAATRSKKQRVGLIRCFNAIVRERQLEPMVAELGDHMRVWWAERRG